MFRRLNNDLPEEPTYPTGLAELGFMIDDQGEFVTISNPDGPNQHFVFFASDNERLNEVRKEAMHTAVREAVEKEMAAFGVKPVYLGGEDGATILGRVQPENKHIRIYATELEALKDKKDVIVVVGEHSQDPGIWAWRSVMREGGINKGTALGMFKQLQNLPLTCETPNKRTSRHDPKLTYEERCGPYPKVDLPSGSMLTKDYTADDEQALVDNMPGIIILSPGQLLYSHAENKCMTHASWNARQRPNAISEAYAIDVVENLVPGHTTAEEHMKTAFDQIIPEIVREDVNLYVIGVTDGAEHFINWYDLNITKEGTLANNIWAMAFLEPTHDPKAVNVARANLHSMARGWTKSSRPLEKFINSPEATLPYVQPMVDISERSPCPPPPPTPAGSDVSSITNGLSGTVEEFQLGEDEAEPTDFEGLNLDAASTGVVVTAPANEGEYDYTTRFVSCPTFSGGVAEIDELLLGAAMPAVLEFFVYRAEEPY